VIGVVRRERGRLRLRPRRLDWGIAVLFMIGSFGFAMGSVGAYASAVGPHADAVTFFASSIFFTAASFWQLVQSQSPATRPAGTAHDDQRQQVWLFAWRPHDKNWLAAVAQFPGTLFFNVTTYQAITVATTNGQYDRVVWRPDFFGSILFLVASAFAILALGKVLSWRPWDDWWWIAWLNMLGSIAFMVSAVGAFVTPTTGTTVDVSLADRGTLAGAICFFFGALLVIPAWRPPAAEPAGGGGRPVDPGSEPADTVAGPG
jgi:hypothetical protein